MVPGVYRFVEDVIGELMLFLDPEKRRLVATQLTDDLLLQLCEQPSVRSKGYDKETAMAAADVPRISSKCIRTNVIHELVTAERDYVKLLNDLVDVSFILFCEFLVNSLPAGRIRKRPEGSLSGGKFKYFLFEFLVDSLPAGRIRKRPEESGSGRKNPEAAENSNIELYEFLVDSLPAGRIRKRPESGRFLFGIKINLK